MKPAAPSDLTSFLEKNNARIHEELFEFLRIPSVSARSEHNADTARAAEWVRQSMEKAGLKATDLFTNEFIDKTIGF
jgi:acetylornithine deacetylase/succinyl-diaminopimelate desuccinylase-like protein